MSYTRDTIYATPYRYEEPPCDEEAHRRDVLEDRIYALTNGILADEARLVAALNAFYGQSDMHDLVVALYLKAPATAHESEIALAMGIEAAARRAAEQQMEAGK